MTEFYMVLHPKILDPLNAPHHSRIYATIYWSLFGSFARSCSDYFLSTHYVSSVAMSGHLHLKNIFIIPSLKVQLKSYPFFMAFPDDTLTEE